MPKKQIKGVVTSTKMNKTAVVTVGTRKKHPVYKKLIKVTKKYMARNDIDIKEGDEVIIEETKPFSKNVTWRVVKNLSKEENKK